MELVECTSRTADTLGDAVASADEGSAVVCAFVDLYASGREAQDAPDVVAESLLGERIRYFQHDQRAASEIAAAGALIRNRQQLAPNRYVLCVSGIGPLGPSPALESTFDAVCIMAPSEKPPESMLHVQEWAASLREGASVDEVRTRIAESATGEDEVDQALAIALSQAGQPVQAFEAISRFLSREKSGSDAGVLAMAARFALEAGQPDQAATLVRRVIDDCRASPLALHTAAATARSLTDKNLRQLAAATLHQRVPFDPLGLALLAECLIRSGSVEQAVDLLKRHADYLDDEGKYLLAMATFRAQENGAISAFMEAAPPGMRQRAIADTIWHASKWGKWGQVDESLAMVRDGEGYEDEVARAVCGAIKAWTLADRPRRSEEDWLSWPRGWLSTVLGVLAARPEQVDGRQRVESLTGPEGLGEVVALAILLPLLRTPALKADHVPCHLLEDGTTEDAAAFLSFFRELDSRRDRVLVIPKSLPRKVPAEEAARLLRGGVSLADPCGGSTEVDRRGSLP
jgi:tetratricopeptide (TPR) repeat protein